MRANLEHHFAVPICVALLVGRDRPPLANLDYPREQEILEHLVVLAKGARKPSKASACGSIQRALGCGRDIDWYVT